MITGSPKILIIEDDPAIKRAFEFILGKNGYETLSASDGKTALQLAMDQHPNLIILDLMIPEISGLKILQKIRESEKMNKALVFIFTNLSDEKDKKMAKKLGANGYFVKAETSIEDIIKQITKILPPLLTRLTKNKNRV